MNKSPINQNQKELSVFIRILKEKNIYIKYIYYANANGTVKDVFNGLIQPYDYLSATFNWNGSVEGYQHWYQTHLQWCTLLNKLNKK